MKKEEKKEKWSNEIPDWLNILLVGTIFITLLIGAVVFYSKLNQASGAHDYEAFIPSGLCLGLYFVILFITNLFSSSDFATVMMVTLLITGLAILSIGIFSKNESNKSTAFELASPILGLALGIPFGERLRLASRKNEEDETETIAKTKRTIKKKLSHEQI
jgi:ABC-type transport system involved in multi-copper enzyme maturation permease subunit